MDFNTILFVLVPLIFLYFRDVESVDGLAGAALRLAGGIAAMVAAALAGRYLLRRRVRRYLKAAEEYSHPASRPKLAAISGMFSMLLCLIFVAEIELLQIKGSFEVLLFPSDWFVVSDLLLMAPYLAALVYLKAETSRLSLVLRGDDAGLGRHLLLTVRTLGVAVLPQFLYLNVFRLVVTDVPVLSDWFHEHPVGTFLLAGTLLLLLFMASPYLIRLLFARVPLQEHPAASVLLPAIEELSRQTGVKFGRMYVWLTGERRIPNAAVSGLLGRQVTIFVTDFLLQSLRPAEVIAVIAHEVGHVKFKHLLFNLLLAVMTGVFVLWAYVLVAPHMETQEEIAFWVVGLQLLYVVGIFGAFARRFERQADMYAAHAVSNPHTLSAALLGLARAGGLSVSRASVTHPSIRSRVHSLARTYRKHGGDLRNAVRNAGLGNLAWAAVMTAALAVTIYVFEGLSD